MKPRILFLVPADYDGLRRKGVDRMIRERDEGGFFERVVTVHPLAQHDRTIDLDGVHRIHEFSLGRALAPGGARLRALVTAPFRLVAILRALVGIARDERIDLVRANDPYLMGVMGWWIARAMRIPYCVSLHADYAKRFELTPRRGIAAWIRRLARVLPPFVFRRASMVLPIRQHMVEWIEQQGGNRDATRVIPHGIDLAPFIQPSQLDARALFDVPADATVVSFVGRLSGDNYAHDIGGIVEGLARSRPRVAFVLVGEGPEEDNLRRRLLQPDGAFANVRIVPFKPYDDIVALRRISAASLCLMGGFSLIEACAAASPAVAYDVEWHRELVHDGVTGFLVEEHDVRGAVAALERLVDDPARAQAMGQEARRLAFANHDLKMTSAIKRQCYTDLLHRRHRLAG